MPPVSAGRNAARSPRDFTGKLFAQQQQAKAKADELAGVDIEAVRHAAYEAGREAGYYEGIRFVQENFDVYELEDEENEE
jgi:hypothetical protein